LPVDDFQAAPEKREVAAQEERGDFLVGEFRVADVVAVFGVGVAREIIGAHLVEFPELEAAGVLKRGQAEDAAAAVHGRVAHDAGTVVETGGGRRGGVGDFVRADEGQAEAVEAAGVADRVAEVGAKLQRDGDFAHHEIAPEVGVGAALHVGGFEEKQAG
jgi:hypothetical protein